MTSTNTENGEPSQPSATTGETVNVAMDDQSDRLVLPPINFENDRFPYCIVWTPIPVLTWLLPMIGHMGICTSTGVIRDFAGPYYVSEDSMGFGRPTRYLRLNPKNVAGGPVEWDEAVAKASVLYGTRMHNLFCDNCHSHVATALCGMRYNRRNSWNMVVLALWIFVCGRYVGFGGFVKTWLPFVIVVSLCTFLAVYL
ncbi:transmembrane protein 222 [Zeugodacus cucurbitae]|uniref:Transmembrane protein 222 n=1 Tax=Zeugodacus cucurbitae TaxID=28588 RepID=A0A0A1XMF5_ZEUCU|nr:transmembrane protein 222 [Zeugodacus cucurbitae]